jgi:hypothetical protein
MPSFCENEIIFTRLEPFQMYFYPSALWRDKNDEFGEAIMTRLAKNYDDYDGEKLERAYN